MWITQFELDGNRNKNGSAGAHWKSLAEQRLFTLRL